MPSLNDVVRLYADLTEEDLEWLHLLVADWQLLADLSFADLVLWIPERGGQGFRAAAQMRPTTGPTAYVDDVVTTRLPRGRRPIIDAAYDERRLGRDSDPEWWDEVPVRVEAIPVCRGNRVLAVISRNTNLAGVRTPSRLELVYLETAGLLAQMVATGRFPTPGTDLGPQGAPRVGDGMIRLDAQGVVSYASPNAVSAYRRLGLTADLVGQQLGRLSWALAPVEGPLDEALEKVLGGRAARLLELQARGVVLAQRVIPLDVGTGHLGALVLCRDVSEVRRREQELLSKDATIRETHHRVKNNLQTVAALLRIQARRVEGESARVALAEAEHRVGTIALVHETLARTTDDTVAFDDVVDRLLVMATELASAQTTVDASRGGSFGVLRAMVATPLAMVLNELLQNSVEHGLGGRAAGKVRVQAARAGETLEVLVEDDGTGLPGDFDAQATQRLGLQIVQTLVHAELRGTITFARRAGGGTSVRLCCPLTPS